MPPKKITIQLYSKSAEIFSLIPKKYRGIILESLISKSLDNGDLIKELSIYLTNEEIEEFKEKLKERGIKSYKSILNKKNVISEINKKNNGNKDNDEMEEIKELFIGFDD